MRRMGFVRDFQSSARSHNAPGTVALVSALVLFFVLTWARVAPELLLQMGFITDGALSRPWSFFTYPFVGTIPPIGLLFLCLWLWGIGGSVERDLGTGRYLGAFFFFSFLCALALFIGASAIGTSTGLFSAFVPVAAITIMWGTRNPESPVMLMFVLPIKGKYIAWLSAGLVFFGTTHPALAPFAAAPLALAYFYAANRLPIPYGRSGGFGTKSSPPGRSQTRFRVQDEAKYFDDVRKRQQEREERERLRKLFESSMKDDEPER
jgi:membrane associated rhomboid family serine protease